MKCEISCGRFVTTDISTFKAAQVTGSLFQENCDSGTASSIFTGSYVDHAEFLEALEKYKAMGQWCLGDLDGHEFLAIFPMAASLSLADH